MKFCKGEYIAKFAEKIISAKHQVKPYGLDLTVGGVYAAKKGGDIDFGGSEQKNAMAEQLAPAKKEADDAYGWWSLTAGEYIVEFNEKIVVPDGCTASLQPLPRTVKAGVFHPALTYRSGDRIDSVLLVVGKAGVNIKENARISSLSGMTAMGE